jgi:hypothetical protein
MRAFKLKSLNITMYPQLEKKGAWAWVPEQIPQKTKQKSWCDSKLDVWIGPNF